MAFSLLRIGAELLLTRERERERQGGGYIHSFTICQSGLTQYAGLAQAGDGLSVVSAGEDRRCAWAGDALRVRCWIFDRVQVCRPDLIIGRGVTSTTPGKQHTSYILIKCV